ncbi:MAG TPA: DUF945 domain-containing protein [Gammaproteobacteria bacterium]|nr:DUF945 domain-containing protein [Gammaproteobacteria bacterium]
MSTKRIGIAEVLLWVFVFILILLSFTPFALGFKIKSDYTQLMANLAEMMQLELQIENYEQGLFSSEVSLSVLLPDNQGKIKFKEEIVHGPVYFGMLSQGKSPLVAAVIKGELDVLPGQQAMIKKLFADKTPMVYQHIVDFSGNLETQSYIPPVNNSFEGEQGTVTIESAGIVINERFNLENGQLSGDMKLPVFKMKTPVYSINANGMKLSFSGGMGEHQIVIGDSAMSVNLFEVNSESGQFSLRDFAARTVTSETGSLINSGTNISVQEVLASNQKFGPLRLDFKLNGISALALNQLQVIQDEVVEMKKKGLPEEQINSMMTGQIMGVVPDLIKQAEVKIDPLSISSELGELKADMDFALQGIDADTPADPMFLLGAVSMDLNVFIDKPLLRQFVSWQLENSASENLPQGAEDNLSVDQKVAVNIQDMIDRNWLKESVQGYNSKVSMHQGELLINEKPVDPMQQIMSSMGGPEH